MRLASRKNRVFALKKMKSIQLRLPYAWHEKLTEKSKIQEIALSEYLRDIIGKEVKKLEKLCLIQETKSTQGFS